MKDTYEIKLRLDIADATAKLYKYLESRDKYKQTQNTTKEANLK